MKAKARAGESKWWQWQKAEWVGGLDFVSVREGTHGRREEQGGVAEARGQGTARGLGRVLVQQGLAGPGNPQNPAQKVLTARLRERNGCDQKKQEGLNWG